MDNESILLDKKVKEYGFNENNFSAPSELMVTITLDEYRKLVSNDATREQAIKKAEADKYERNNQIEHLTKEVAALKAELYETKKALEMKKEEEET